MNYLSVKKYIRTFHVYMYLAPFPYSQNEAITLMLFFKVCIKSQIFEICKLVLSQTGFLA